MEDVVVTFVGVFMLGLWGSGFAISVLADFGIRSTK